MFVLYLLLIMVCIALNAYFVTVEFAVVSARPERLNRYAPPGKSPVWRWIQNERERDKIIAAAQLGITLSSLALGAVGEQTVEWLLAQWVKDLTVAEWMLPAVHALPYIGSFLVVTGVHVILGEQVPKVAVLRQPEKALVWGARGMQVFLLVFRWFIALLDGLTRGTLRLLGLPVTGEARILTLEELRFVLRQAREAHLLPMEEGEIMDAVLDLSHLLVRHVMVPRTEIVAVEADAPLGHVLALAAKYDFTKFPVYEGRLDNILGIVHVNQILKVLHTPEFARLKARDLVTEALFVPETTPVRDLLRVFRERKQHIALVLDEYGGIAGLVTLHDALTEIVGEFQDRFGPKELPDVQRLPDGSLRLDGMALLEDVSEALNLPLHSEHYDTVAGFVLEHLGRIPQEGEMLELPELGIRLIVEKMDGLRIDQVRLEWLRPQAKPTPKSASLQAT